MVVAGLLATTIFCARQRTYWEGEQQRRETILASYCPKMALALVLMELALVDTASGSALSSPSIRIVQIPGKYQ